MAERAHAIRLFSTVSFTEKSLELGGFDSTCICPFLLPSSSACLSHSDSTVSHLSSFVCNVAPLFSSPPPIFFLLCPTLFVCIGCDDSSQSRVSQKEMPACASCAYVCKDELRSEEVNIYMAMPGTAVIINLLYNKLKNKKLAGLVLCLSKTVPGGAVSRR